ncbi:pseudouridine synthase [Nonomuraea basaltis]|nr:pseudouridine synthase [Nonomuraea basaltis]
MSDARPSRDSLRADRGGSRARYGGSPGGNDGDSRYPRGGGREERSPRSDREDRHPRGDREDRFSRGDREQASRGDRDDRTTRGDRYERPRGDRDGYRSDRRDERGGGYTAGRRDDRGGYAAGRRDDRGGYAAGRRDDRGGYGTERRDDRGGFRADRSGRRDTDGTGRGGREADRTTRGGGREDAASRGGSSTRSRYGRRDGDARPARTDRAPRRDGDARPARTDRAPRRDDVQTVGKAYGSPQRDRIKAARQPIRDRDLYPEGYTDVRDTTEVPDGVRLQKVLAQAGVASRRACEEMIGEGRVTVNGQVVRRFGAKVDPATQVIHVDGKRIPTAPDLVYYALNKPIGVVSTMDDPQGRPCLADYVEELAPRLFHVGRLDTETEGLLLLTNDGELANRLTHPSYGVQKKYWAKVPGPIPRDLGRRLRQGIELEDGIAKADGFTVVQEHGQQALVEVVLHEGRKHVVRRMLEEAGHRVIDLARIEFGPVKLGRTKPGTVRALSLKEVGELYAAVKL